MAGRIRSFEAAGATLGRPELGAESELYLGQDGQVGLQRLCDEHGKDVEQDCTYSLRDFRIVGNVGPYSIR
jgi:hypothetical protein